MGNCNSKKKEPNNEGQQLDAVQSKGINILSQAKKHQLNGQYKEAVKCYKKSIKNSGPSAEAYNGIANVYSYQRQYFDAIQYYQKALQIDRSYKYSYNGLGNVYDYLQKDEDAVGCYKRAIRIDPGFAYPHNGIANFYYSRKMFREALASYKEAQRLDNGNPLIHANMACCLIYLGKFDESFDQFDEAKKLAQNQEQLSQPNKKYLQQKLNEFKRQLDKADGKQKQKYRQKMENAFNDDDIEDGGIQKKLTSILNN